MAPSKLSHRMFIDDQNATVGSPNSRMSFFQFDDQLWEDKEGRGSFMGTHTHAPMNSPASLATIHFMGTGITIAGVSGPWCDDPSNPVVYSASLDESDSGFSEVSVANDDPFLLYQTNSDEPLEDRRHTITLSDFRRQHNFSCSPLPELGTSLDYALIAMSSRTPIRKQEDWLLASYNDSTIVYSEGGWSRADSKYDCFLGVQCMETAQAGASMSFTFFGNAVSLLGYNPLNSNEDQNLTAVLSFSLDDGPVVDQVIPAQQLARHEFYSATNLGRRPNYAPHTLNMTLKQLATDNSQRFQISGYMYSPTFASLSEADDMYAQWSNRSPSANGAKNLVAPVVGGVIGFVVLLFLVALVWLHRRKIKRLRNAQEETRSEVGKTAAASSYTPARPGETPTPYMKSYCEPTDAMSEATRTSAVGSNGQSGSTIRSIFPTPFTKAYDQTDDRPMSESTGFSSISGWQTPPGASLSTSGSPVPPSPDPSASYGTQDGLDRRRSSRLVQMVEQLAARMDMIESPPAYPTSSSGHEHREQRDN